MYRYCACSSFFVASFVASQRLLCCSGEMSWQYYLLSLDSPGIPGPRSDFVLIETRSVGLEACTSPNSGCWVGNHPGPAVKDHLVQGVDV